MNQFLADNIDQLDLALDQLAVNDRNFDRFALMLIDNVAELTLHKYAQDKASENEMWGRISKPKNDPKILERALSQNFASKVHAACKFGMISQELHDSVLYLHQFRNTAYHKGLRHEGILHSLAIFYFQCVCQVLTSFQPTWFSWSSRDNISHRARKYIGKDGLKNSREVFYKAYERLSLVSESLDGALIEDLSLDMKSTIDSTDRCIDFLATDSPEKMSRDEVVVNAQAWPFAFSEEGKKFAIRNGCPEKCIGPYVEWIAQNYPWTIKSDPINSWRRRHKSLTKESVKHKALKKYCDFLKQTEKIRAEIDESAAQLDAHIQHLIDVARGK
ncbi:hypothetical protein [Cerasicoccus fimbriatus]|uniref:hypothetical protein n=1 Tax=Cerasicoccus fimbriatus TaxID=3014554 RepID=UPI0022B4054A|nr:hypothetical protein [Cerasicoccus sp. TK19100]